MVPEPVPGRSSKELFDDSFSTDEGETETAGLERSKNGVRTDVVSKLFVNNLWKIRRVGNSQFPSTSRN